jgi:hypothetical protein
MCQWILVIKTRCSLGIAAGRVDAQHRCSGQHQQARLLEEFDHKRGAFSDTQAGSEMRTRTEPPNCIRVEFQATVAFQLGQFQPCRSKGLKEEKIVVHITYHRVHSTPGGVRKNSLDLI